MLNHTKKIKEIYEVIQKMIFYMIPEKWDKLYLYSSVIDMPEGKKTGELYFYYIPKGILRKKPVNVYEIPSKFNIDEEEYLKLVKTLIIIVLCFKLCVKIKPVYSLQLYIYNSVKNASLSASVPSSTNLPFLIKSVLVPSSATTVILPISSYGMVISV